MRAGTEPVAGIAAFGKACAIAMSDMRQEWERQQQLQQRLEHGLREQIPAVRIQGVEVPRLPNTTNVAFAGVEGEALLMSLDLQGGRTVHWLSLQFRFARTIARAARHGCPSTLSVWGIALQSRAGDNAD